MTLTLIPSLQITGRVRDETTRKPIGEHVVVEAGIVDPKTGEVARWEQNSRARVRQGHFQADLNASRSPAYKLRIAAMGYEPFVSRSLESREGAVYLDVHLKKLAAEPKNAVTAILLVRMESRSRRFRSFSLKETTAPPATHGFLKARSPAPIST